MVTVAEPVPLLLERDAEQARLSALLEQARAGSGAVVTISGPASAGERRLLAGPARAGAGALGLAAGDSPVSEFAAVHGLYWLCANLAEPKPLLLTVDDLHWVDGPSLAWLAYLGPRCAESAMLLVLTIREGDPRERANSVAAAAGDPSVHRMRLSALSVASVAALVRAELGPTASAEFCSACS